VESIIFRNKVVFWSIVLVLLFVFIVLAKTAFTPKSNLSKKTATPTPIEKTINVCSQFSADQGEISCEEAKGIALKKYPGKLLSVEKTVRNYESGIPPKRQTKEAKVWIIGVKPDDQSIFPPVSKDTNNVKAQTIDTIGVIVDRNTKEVLFFEAPLKNK